MLRQYFGNLALVSAAAVALAAALAGCAGSPSPERAAVQLAGSTSHQAATDVASPLKASFQSRSIDAYRIDGIDVSKFQGDIDWSAVKSAGVDFAYIKATEGGDVFDDRFRDNWRGAKHAGVHRGAYHFYYFCRPAKEQVKWFIRHVPKDADALPPVLDMEWNAHSPTCKIRPPKETVVSEMKVFLDALERHYGQKPIIYTSVDFHRDNLVGEFNDYTFWLRAVADYPDDIYSDRDWLFWQHTGTGSVAGVSGEVDRNVFAGNGSHWRRWVQHVTD